MVSKLNLAMMNKNDEEMKEKELNAVKGELPACQCSLKIGVR